MDLNQLKSFFNQQKWIFAKTYAAFAPHEYIVKDKIIGFDREFTEAVETILDKGMRMFYYKKERKYLFLDGYFYWAMTNNPAEATIINRCKPEDYDIVFMKRGTQK